MTYANKITDLLMDIKTDFNNNGIPLLNTPSPTMAADFVEIILYSVKARNIIDNGHK